MEGGQGSDRLPECDLSSENYVAEVDEESSLTKEIQSLRSIIRNATSYRQGEMFARLGIDIPRSTLISWTGSAIAELRPIVEVIRRSALTATHLHCDDTKIPVLAPKTGKTWRATKKVGR